MPTTTKPTELRLQIERDTAPLLSKRYVCPDGLTRRLQAVLCGKNGFSALYFEGGHHHEIDNYLFWETWKDQYQPEEADPDAPVSLARMAEVVTTPALSVAQAQGAMLFQDHNLTQTLMDQIQRVKSNPAGIPQAKQINEMAKTVIEIEKSKLEAMKLAHTINNGSKK